MKNQTYQFSLAFWIIYCWLCVCSIFFFRSFFNTSLFPIYQSVFELVPHLGIAIQDESLLCLIGHMVSSWAQRVISCWRLAKSVWTRRRKPEINGGGSKAVVGITHGGRDSEDPGGASGIARSSSDLRDCNCFPNSLEGPWILKEGTQFNVYLKCSKLCAKA